MSEPVPVGRVAKAHGIRGEVSIEILSDHPERFAVGALLGHRDAQLTVETVRPHQGRLLVKFEEVADRNDAERLRGAMLTVPSAERLPLPEGRYYPSDLVGLDVVAADGTTLGRFARVVESPAHDLWAVAVGAREVLVPAVEAFIVSVDLPARRITLDPPEGLF